MPLLIDFKAGDKIIINGAVIENSGTNSKILLHNKASVLRAKEVLKDEDAQTPATRTYFALQNAYIFKEHQDEHLAQFHTLLSDYVQACPSAKDISDDIEALVSSGNLYKALKQTQKLIIHELDLLKSLESEMQGLAGKTGKSPAASPEADSQ